MLGRLRYSRPVRWLTRTVVGNPQRLPRRAAAVTVFVLIATTVFGAWYLATRDIDPRTSSITYLKPVLWVVTNPWLPTALIALITFQLQRVKRDKYAELAANVTGFSTETVKRLAAEATSSDGTRVVVTSEDDVDEIDARIDGALESGEDDRLALNPEAFEVVDDDRDGSEDEGEAAAVDERKHRGLLGSAWALVSATVRRVLWLPIRSVKIIVVGWLIILKWLSARLKRIVLAVTYPVRYLVGVLTALLWRPMGDTDDDADEGSEAGFEWGPDGRDDDRGASEGDEVSDTLTDDPERDDTAADREDESDDVPEAVEDEWRTEWKHFKMDLAARIRYGDLLWHLVLPAAIVLVIELLVARIWVVPWLYPVMVAGALLVGLGHYLVRVKWWRKRRLRALREDAESQYWNELALLVKAVERPETTMYYGTLAGRRYAHPEREVFCRELAKRANDKVNGLDPAPSIMEKYAHQLEQLYPDLYAYRDDEKARIMDLLREHVRESAIGLMPKQKLIEDVIEYDVSGGGLLGSDAPVGGRSKSDGFDPELVREAYRELVPVALVEHDVVLPDRREGVDETTTVTAVRLREDPLPPQYSEVRAQFASQFSNFAEWEPIYQLPDVDDQLEEEPIYAGGDAEPPERTATV